MQKPSDLLELNVNATSKFAKYSDIESCKCIAELLDLILDLLKKKEVYVKGEDNHLYEYQWCFLFAEFILGNAHCSRTDCLARSDDMVWYVPITYVTNYTNTSTSHIQVFRRQSRNKPIIGDTNINWEETVCLNVILQQLDYYVSCAVCTKTPPNNLHILRKNSQKVYPSPSRRRMDVKGQCEEITYPKIFFCIDNFDQVFIDAIVTEGECLCVELVAHDRYRNKEAVLFLGSIRYDVLKKVYDSKNSGTWNWAHKLMTTSLKRYEFVRMKGPKGRGFAEMAISQVASCGFETPMSDNFDFRSTIETDNRRMSDTGFLNKFWFGNTKRGAITPGANSSTLNNFSSWNFHKNRRFQGDSASVSGRLDYESKSVNGDELSNSRTNSSSNWSMRNISQALSFLKEKQETISLNAYLTNIMLPWHSILEDMLSPTPRTPIITFELDFFESDRI